MRAFYSDHFVLPLPEGHKFPMAKYAGLRARILSEGIVDPADLHEAPAASWDDLRLVHDAAYVDAVASGTVPKEVQRRIGFPWSPGWWNARDDRWARRSRPRVRPWTRASLRTSPAARIMRSPIAARASACSTTWRSATRVLQRDHHARRVAIVDLDVHQGNGTAAIFQNDASVFTFSMHGDKNFPFRKETSNLDVALPDGTSDAEYLAALDTHLTAVLNQHQPDFVFYLAGADPYEGDRLGRLKLTIDGLARRDALVFAQCRARRLPVAVTMAGGYATDIDAIVTIHSNTIRLAALCHKDFAY